MTKADLLGPAKTKVLRSLRPGPKTAREVATDLGIQVSAARKHLARLLEWKIVSAEFVRASRGRPKKVFALTEDGVELFPRRYDAVLNGVLVGLVAESGEEFTRRILAGVAADLVERGGEAAGTRRMDRAVALLGELGFDVSLERRDGQAVLTSRNCPILRTAKAHRELVCVGLHAELIRRATGGRRVNRGKWIVTGDPVCTHVLEA